MTQTSSIPPSLAFAQTLLAQLIAQGVRDIVLCPGSRSAPLAYALVQADRAGLVRMHVRIDERTAGFFALGLGKSSGVPAAVFTTSGTAVANLHPAVLEAHHSNIPLLVLTADRPHELRGTGANQTTSQPGIFGNSVRLMVDSGVPAGAPHEHSEARAIAARAYAAAIGVTGSPGPAHLNLGFRDPLAPDAQQLAEIAHRFQELPATIRLAGHARTVSSPDGALFGEINTSLNTVIIAGDGALSEAGALAVAQGWPIIAEPSSGVVCHSHALPGGVNLLAAGAYAPEKQVPGDQVSGNQAPGTWQAAARDLVSQVKQVFVFGHPTLTRPVQQLIARPDVYTVVVPTHVDQWVDASRTANAILYSLPQSLLEQNTAGEQWLHSWQQAHGEMARSIDAHLSTASDLSVSTAPMRVVREVVAAAKPQDTLVFGASSAIRDADSYVTTWPQGVRVLAHRGLAGIDGTLSMALGVAANTPGNCTVVVGDLTFLHDAGALLRGPQEPSINLNIVLLNDNGGAIFGGLEHSAAGDLDLFERAFGTPHNADFAALCAGYGVSHQVVTTSDELAEFLGQPAAGIRVAEVKYGRSERTKTHKKLVS